MINTKEEAQKLVEIKEKAQSLLDAMYPDDQYRLTVSIGTRDGSLDHGNFRFLLDGSREKENHTHTI